MPLLVNADDFGKSAEINRAVAEAFERGYITHTTLMANMPAAEEAVDLARQKGFAERVGLHLNLTEGLPLSLPIRENPLICSTDGSFNQAFYHTTRYRLYMDSLAINQIAEEFAAQLKRYLELGLTELHIDSHHHVHTNYPVYLALKSLKSEYDFSYIRPSRNLYRGGNILNRIYKLCYNRGIKKICRNTSELFGSYSDFMSFTGGEQEKALALVKEKKIEIMVHPMYREGVLSDTELPMEEEELLISLLKEN